MWLIVLSDQRPIVALVSLYPTNQLIGHGPLFQRPTDVELCSPPQGEARACGIVGDFSPVFLTGRQVTHVILTRPPLPRVAARAFDLHVLGTPPAFILSQDQTRHPMAVSCLLARSRGNGPWFELRSRPSCCYCCLSTLGCSQMSSFISACPTSRARRTALKPETDRNCLLVRARSAAS